MKLLYNRLNLIRIYLACPGKITSNCTNFLRIKIFHNLRCHILTKGQKEDSRLFIANVLSFCHAVILSELMLKNAHLRRQDLKFELQRTESTPQLKS